MRFAELTAGRVIHLGPASLTEREIVEFARAYDPQWFHTDPVRAATSQWQGLIASGWQTCGVAMRLMVDHILAGSESFGSPGSPISSGRARCAPAMRCASSSKSSTSGPQRAMHTLGIVRWRWRLANQRSEPVLDLEATSLFDLSRA
jgi:acyl dehydratase